MLPVAPRASGEYDGVLVRPRAQGDLALHAQGTESSTLPDAAQATAVERSLYAAMQHFQSSCGWKTFALASQHFLCTRDRAGVRGGGGIAAKEAEHARAHFQMQSTKVATERLKKLAGLCWAERQALRRLAPAACPAFDIRILSACIGEVMSWWPLIDGSSGTSATLSLDARALLDSTAQLLVSFGCKSVAAYIGARIAQPCDPAIEARMTRFLRANGTSLADVQLRACEWAIGPSAARTGRGGSSRSGGDDVESASGDHARHALADAMRSAQQDPRQSGAIVVVCANQSAARETHACLEADIRARSVGPSAPPSAPPSMQLVLDAASAAPAFRGAATVVLPLRVLLATLLGVDAHAVGDCLGVILLEDLPHIIACREGREENIAQLLLVAPCAIRIVGSGAGSEGEHCAWIESVIRAVEPSSGDLAAAENAAARHHDHAGGDPPTPRAVFREQRLHIFDAARSSLQRVHPLALLFGLAGDGVHTHFADVVTEAKLRERLAALPPWSPTQAR